MFNNIPSTQAGPPRALRGPGGNLFRGPYSQFFRTITFLPPPRRQHFMEKNFPDKYVFIAFVALSPTFSIPNFGTLPEIFRPKKLLGPHKTRGGREGEQIAPGPQALGARGNLPPSPLSAGLQTSNKTCQGKLVDRIHEKINLS